MEGSDYKWPKGAAKCGPGAMPGKRSARVLLECEGASRLPVVRRQVSCFLVLSGSLSLAAEDALVGCMMRPRSIGTDGAWNDGGGGAAFS